MVAVAEQARRHEGTKARRDDLQARLSDATTHRCACCRRIAAGEGLLDLSQRALDLAFAINTTEFDAACLRADQHKDAAATQAAEDMSVPPAPAHSGCGDKDVPCANFAARDDASLTASAVETMEPTAAEAAVGDRWDGLS